MLIALYFIVMNILPMMGSSAIMAINELMPAIIMLAGIMLMMGAVGMKVSAGLGTTIVGGLFSAIGFVARRLFNGLGWLIRGIPLIYRALLAMNLGFGLNMGISTFMAVVTTVIIII